MNEILWDCSSLPGFLLLFSFILLLRCQICTKLVIYRTNLQINTMWNKRKLWRWESEMFISWKTSENKRRLLKSRNCCVPTRAVPLNGSCLQNSSADWSGVRLWGVVSGARASSLEQGRLDADWLFESGALSMHRLTARWPIRARREKPRRHVVMFSDLHRSEVLPLQIVSHTIKNFSFISLLLQFLMFQP